MVAKNRLHTFSLQCSELLPLFGQVNELSKSSILSTYALGELQGYLSPTTSSTKHTSREYITQTKQRIVVPGHNITNLYTSHRLPT